MVNKQSIIGLVVAMLLVGVGRADAEIMYGTYRLYEYGGHYYGITRSRSDWHGSEAEAVALGGHLVAIGSQAEQEWINTTFLPDIDLVAPPVFWIGLTDEATEGTWRWTNGDLLTYTNWNDLSASGGPSEPNDWLGEDYVTINWHYAIAETHAHHVDIKGTWNDANSDPSLPLSDPYADDCPQPFFAVFELESNPVPEPSTLVGFVGLGAMGLIAAWRKRRRGVH